MCQTTGPTALEGFQKRGVAVDFEVGERTARLYLAHLRRFASWLAQHCQAQLLEATTPDLRQYKTDLAGRQKPA